MMNMNRWGSNGDQYIDIEVADGYVTVKLTGGLKYVMQCSNGYEVYKDNSDFGFRDLTEEELAAILREVSIIE